MRKFHVDWIVNVVSLVFTRISYDLTRCHSFLTQHNPYRKGAERSLRQPICHTTEIVNNHTFTYETLLTVVHQKRQGNLDINITFPKEYTRHPVFNLLRSSINVFFPEVLSGPALLTLEHITCLCFIYLKKQLVKWQDILQSWHKKSKCIFS